MLKSLNQSQAPFWICLSPTVAEVSAVEELSNISSSNWEVEVVDKDMDMDDDLELPKMNLNPNKLCQQMNSEMKNKFQVWLAYNRQNKSGSSIYCVCTLMVAKYHWKYSKVLGKV